VADALATNVDRSARNPNLLLWHRRLWLIDHGAALYRQHRGLHPDDAERPFPAIAEHVLLPRAGSIEAAHHRLAPRLPRELLQRVVDLVPPEWLVLAPAQVYVEYLERRLSGGTFDARPRPAVGAHASASRGSAGGARH